MSSKIKQEKKKKQKEKKRIESRCFALKPENGPRGSWRKTLKPGALNLYWLEAADFVFATRVDGWSLASCRYWRLEIIRSPG